MIDSRYLNYNFLLQRSRQGAKGVLISSYNSPCKTHPLTTQQKMAIFGTWLINKPAGQ